MIYAIKNTRNQTICEADTESEARQIAIDYYDDLVTYSDDYESGIHEFELTIEHFGKVRPWLLEIEKENVKSDFEEHFSQGDYI